MTGTSSSRGTQLALAGIALVAFALRAFPFLGPDGAWSYRVDYDEGVYFSAASMLLEGVLPYRDFVFVHPPGLLVFLAGTSAWTHSFLGVDGAFACSRWIAAVLGAVNVWLVGRLVLRWSGPDTARWGALVAAALYATYPEVVQVERGPFLEPLLNLVCLSMAIAVVNASERAQRERWLILAGGLAGLALSIKVWAVIWGLGALWAVSTFASRRQVLLFLGAALGACGLVVLPFALQAPEAFVTEVGLFHLWRPPDGLVQRLPRLEQIVAQRHLLSPLLALLTVGLSLFRRGPPWGVAARIVVTAWALTLAAFFASGSYWSQYNAHLIASEAVLAGALVAWVLARFGAVRPVSLVIRVLAASVGVSLLFSLLHTQRRSQSDAQHLALARTPLRNLTDCIFTFEPGWSLAAGRLPPRLPGVPLVLDSYAHQLLGAVSGGLRFPDSAAAFAANQTPLPVLQQCDFVVLGDRGRRQLSPQLQGKLAETHAPVTVMGLEVWTRIPPR